MQRRNSRLFESGSDSIKRDLFDSFSRTSMKKNSTIMDANGQSIVLSEVDYLKEENSKALTQNKNNQELIRVLQSKVYVTRNDQEVQCDIDASKSAILRDLIKQKDESIGNYERQIKSFREIIQQRNQQNYQLLEQIDKLESQLYSKQQKIKHNDIGIQVESVESVEYQEQETQVDKVDVVVYDAIPNKYERQLEILMRDYEALKNNNEETMKINQYVESDNRVKEKQITSLTQEVQRLQMEIQLKKDCQNSVGSAETVISPKETPNSKLTQSAQVKLKKMKQQTNYFKQNVQKIDQCVLLEEQLLEMMGECNDVKSQFAELIRQHMQLQEEHQNIEMEKHELTSKLNEYETSLRNSTRIVTEKLNIESELTTKYTTLAEELRRIQQQYKEMSQDYQIQKNINQSLHQTLDKLQNKQSK